MFRSVEAALERHAPWLVLLAPLSWAWGLWVTVKNFLYDIYFLKPVRLVKPVISVGNLVAGGVGKTPLVVLIAEELAPRRVAILSRGYRTADEPELLRRRLPHAMVYVDGDRVRAGRKAIAEGAEVLLLDDGFQHRRLARDLDLLVLSGDDPWGGGHFLPWGLLRDAPERVGQAHFVFVNPFDGAPPYRNGVGVRVEPVGWLGVEPPPGAEVGLFCGIARPERFRQMVEGMGYRVVEAVYLPDHGAIEWERLRGRHWVCTEKDWVKLPPHEMPIGALQIAMRVTGGEWARCKAALHLISRGG